MAIENLYPISVAALFDYICNPVNDIDHMWIYHHDEYMGSLFPKQNKPIYQNDELTLLLYIKKDDTLWEPLQERTIVINSVENYAFHYL
jgi:hypothetical protein